MFVKYFLLVSTIWCCANALFGSMKNVTVVGKLHCDDAPAMDVVVELWEDDTVLGMGSDDRLDVTATDYEGLFHVFGKKREILSIEPYILIKHNCGNKSCNFNDRRDISRRYMGRTYDMGTVELSLDREVGRSRAVRCSQSSQ